MNQLEVHFWTFLSTFWFQEVRRLAQMIVIQGSLESGICGLGEDALLLEDGKNTHGLKYRRKLARKWWNLVN